MYLIISPQSHLILRDVFEKDDSPQKPGGRHLSFYRWGNWGPEKTSDLIRVGRWGGRKEEMNMVVAEWRMALQEMDSGSLCLLGEQEAHTGSWGRRSSQRGRCHVLFQSRQNKPWTHSRSSCPSLTNTPSLLRSWLPTCQMKSQIQLYWGSVGVTAWCLMCECSTHPPTHIHARARTHTRCFIQDLQTQMPSEVSRQHWWGK